MGTSNVNRNAPEPGSESCEPSATRELRQLRWMLAIQAWVGCDRCLLAAGGAAFVVETYRVEDRLHWNGATRSARHFATPAMQVIIAQAGLTAMTNWSACWTRVALSGCRSLIVTAAGENRVTPLR